MKPLPALIVNGLLLLGAINCLHAQNKTTKDEQRNWMVRLAKIEIDTLYLKEYRAAIEEHTKDALAQEPGVLTLYAMYEKANPDKVTVLEIYASKEAYQQHIKTTHFLKYKNGTLHMVKKLELIDVDPIALGAKPGFLNNKEE